jgi:hypothetical protein
MDADKTIRQYHHQASFYDNPNTGIIEKIQEPLW